MSEKDLPETELLLLEALERASLKANSVSQRDLARGSGLSLGMVNILVKRFVDRGWVKLTRASPRTWAYALTPAGFEEVGARTLSFLRKTAATISSFHEKIDAFVLSLRGEGIKGILYEAEPALSFLVRYSCLRHGLSFYDPSQLQFPSAEESRWLVRLVVTPVSPDAPSGDAPLPGTWPCRRTVNLFSILPRPPSILD